MAPLDFASLHQYWSVPFVQTNVLIVLNLLGALALGMLLGYERAYHGRAAGMRTYGLVCMASTALTVIVGYPHFWYGGQAVTAPIDPTRVVQGIVSGIGFLGAGVIMKDGFNIRGLSTAASIWTASAIGVLIGAGFYAAAIVLALICVLAMNLIGELEHRLPVKSPLALTVRFKEGHVPDKARIFKAASELGCPIDKNSLSVHSVGGAIEWRFIAMYHQHAAGDMALTLSERLAAVPDVTHFSIDQNRS